MKYTTLLILFFAFSSAILAQSEIQKTKITSSITAVMNEQTVAWNRGDVDGFMKGYWQSEKLVFISGDDVTRGWQPTVDRYKKSYNSKAKMGVLTFSGLEFNVISKDAAIVLGSWSLARDKDNPHGKFTLTFRKFKEGWRIVMDHTS